MSQNTNIKNDHDALLERIAIAIEEKTGASPDEQTDRKSASGAMLERIAEAIENGSGGGSSGDSPVVWIKVVGTENPATETWHYSCDTTLEEIANYYESGKLVLAYKTGSLDKIENGSIFVLQSAYKTSSGGNAEFISYCRVVSEFNEVRQDILVCDKDDNWTLTTESVSL